MRVAFLHPKMVIGGAERLVLDTALGLDDRGHTVRIFTTNVDSSRCFDEIHPDTGRIDVTQRFRWVPDAVFGRMHALMNYIKMVLLAIHIILHHGGEFDVFFVDQVSACIPILRLARQASVAFYCHFPDTLQSQTAQPTGLTKLYRSTLGWLEEATTGMAHVTFVNSRFTAGIFESTFSSLAARGVSPAVAYPPVPIPVDDPLDDPVAGPGPGTLPVSTIGKFKYRWLSINRYERKKAVDVAIRALDELRKVDRFTFANTVLVVAGGWAPDCPDNVSEAIRLRSLVAELDIVDHVIFLMNVTSPEKAALLRSCTMLMYTPTREHFGIAPIEAMAHRLPVIAVRSGGPVESVSVTPGEETGILCAQDPAEFAAAALRISGDEALQTRMGDAGHMRVTQMFSPFVYIDTIESCLRRLVRAS